jgi:hypothetical protein
MGSAPSAAQDSRAKSRGLGKERWEQNESLLGRDRLQPVSHRARNLVERFFNKIGRRLYRALQRLLALKVRLT